MELTVDVNRVFAQIKLVFLSPKKFFNKAAKEKGWKTAFVFVMVVALAGHILTALYSLFAYPMIAPFLSEILQVPVSQLSPSTILVGTVVSYLLTLGMSFIWGGALKVWLMLFRVNASFSEGYRIMAYSHAPNYLLSWFPVVNILAAFYSFYLLVVGLMAGFGVSRSKAVVVVVSSVLLLIVLSLLLFFLMPSE